jgi:UBX domain-containing protein 1
VKIAVQKRLTEKYVAPKKVLKPFSGSGNRLGSEVPGEVVGGSSSSSSPAATSTPPATTTPQPVPVLANPNEPLTTVQIRLADGTRLVAKFNPTQTVADISRFINLTRAGESQRNYVLMTTFPNKELTDPTVTLQAAGLLNAVVVQRYK